MSESANASSSAESSSLRRVLKWGGGLLGGLAILVLVAALVLPQLFTSEQLKGYVIPPLEDATGRQVEIDDIGLRVLPLPAIRVSGFRLANAEGYGPAPAVEARALNVDVALWPLFVGTIRPTAVGLDAPVIRYEVAEDGSTNFDTLGGEPDTTETEGSPLGGIPLSNVRVTEAQLHYTDRSTGQAVRLDFGAQLGVLPEASAFTSTGTVDLTTVRALLPSIGPDTLSVRAAKATYDVRVAPSAGQADLRSLQLETAPLTLTVEGTLTGLNEQPTADLAFETGTTDLAEITAFAPAAAVEGLNPRGTLNLQGTVKGPLSGETDTTSALSVDATGRLAEVGVDYQGAALLRALSGELSFSLDEAALRSLEGQLLGASLAGAVSVRGLAGTPQVELDLETGPMNVADLAAFVPPEQRGEYNPQGTLRLDASATGPLPSDAASLKKMAINGTGQLAGIGIDYDGQALLRSLRTDLNFSGTTVNAQGIDGQLLGNPVSGAVTVSDLRGTPQVDGQLAGTADLSRLMAFTDDGSSAPSIQGTADYDVRFVGPLQTPDAIRPSGLVQLTDVQVPYESFRQPIEIPGATVQFTGSGFTMDRFTVRSGSETAALQTTMRNLFPISKGLAEENPALSASFTLTADRLDVDALYLDEEGSEVHYSDLFAAQLSGSSVDGQSPEALSEALYGDIELPNYTVDGRIEIGTLLNDPQRFENLEMDLQMKGRRLTVRNLKASTYGGSLSGSLTLDQGGSATSGVRPTSRKVRFASMEMGRTRPSASSAKPPSDLTYNVQLRNADAGTVLQDWTSLGRLVTGTLTLTADGDSRLTEGFLPQTDALSAIGESIVTDGTLGLNLGPAAVLVDVLGLPGASFKDFQRLGGAFVIEEGQFQVEAWPFEAKQFDGTVEGSFGLGGSLNLNMSLNLPLSLIEQSKIGSRLGGNDGRMGEVLKKLLGTPADDETIPVTVRIRGTMQDPSVEVLNQDAIKSRIESLAKEAGLKLLRDLFGGGGSGNQ